MVGTLSNRHFNRMKNYVPDIRTSSQAFSTLTHFVRIIIGLHFISNEISFTRYPHLLHTLLHRSSSVTGAVIVIYYDNTHQR
jgi:hypothetical protein